MATHSDARPSGTADPDVAALLQKLQELWGMELMVYVRDPLISDVLLNPEGTVWVESPRGGRRMTPVFLLPAVATRIVQGMAALAGTQLQPRFPILSMEIGVLNARFVAVVPPFTRAPSFALHKYSAATRRLDDYVAEGLLTSDQAATLRSSVLARRNILIGGGARCGKTTLVNTLLGIMAEQPHRVLLLERAAHLQCLVAHHIPLRALSPTMDLRTLLRAGMRWEPERLVMDNIEGPELPELLQAWQTVCPGGVATTLAESPRSALERLETLLRQDSQAAPRATLSRAVHVVVQLNGQGSTRRVSGLFAVLGSNRSSYRLAPLAR